MTDIREAAQHGVSDQERQGRRRVAILAIVLLALVGVSLFLGRYPGPYWTPLSALFEDPLAQRLVLYLRLPALLGAVMWGWPGRFGVSFQMIFRNPLVEFRFLGVPAGGVFWRLAAIVALGARRSPYS